MNRTLILAVALAAASLAPAAERRILDSKTYHLGVAGMAEWEEFERSTPHGPALEIEFAAGEFTGPATLLIRQRDVKTLWNVSLNGKRLGTLEALAQPLVRALEIPAGLLKSEGNRLSIQRPPSRLVDDIVVSEIALEPRSPAELLSQATLDVTVTEADGGGPVPCRLTLVDPAGALAPWRASGTEPLALRTGVVYTRDGRARLGLMPGTYTLHANRGFEYSVAAQRITLGAGETRTIRLQIRREVPTPGLVACDTHIHTLTHSRHGDATIEERMLTIAGEGIEFAVATDHNHHVDYADVSARMRTEPYFRSVVGNEISTRVGHFNAFPVPVEGPVPNAQLTDWKELLPHIRAVTGARVVTLNHPRDVHYGFSPFGPDHFNAQTGEFKDSVPFDCDAIEVVTSAAIQSDIMRLYHDWFALLNRGLRVAGIGASDTHHVSQFILGQARTYAFCRAEDPAVLDIAEVCDSYRRGRLLVSMGLLTTMRVDERFEVGDLATGLGDVITLGIEVLGPSWVNADRVEVFANGIKVREESIPATPAVTKARLRWILPRPKHDVHLVAIATGPGVTAPYWEISRPYQPTSKVVNSRIIGSTNPIWIDADGDGRFTAAREYARMLVRQAGGDAAKLESALREYDAAVRLHVADLSGRRD